MNTASNHSSRSRFPVAPALVAALLAPLAALGVAGCGGGSVNNNQGSGSAPGSLLAHNDPGLGSEVLIVDANQGGDAQNLKIVGVFWGRLVTVRDSSGTPQQKEMVVGEDIQSDNIDYLLTSNAVTEETSVTILHAAGTPAYEAALLRLDQNLTPVTDKSLDPDELPPFSLVPRNAAVVVRFNDLLDPDLVNQNTLKLRTGNPPTATFESRVLIDVNHGDLVDRDGNGTPEFYSTRAIIDTTTSPLEATASNPPLPPNPVGLPASVTTNQANVALRIPTKTVADAGQLEILRNLSGHPLSFLNNGSVDPDSPTKDVVRAMRSGGNTLVTNDVNNGFLSDDIAPQIVGTQTVVLATPTGGPTDFVVPALTYLTIPCAMPLKAGDVIQQQGVFAEVVEASSLPSGSQIPNVEIRVIFPPNGNLIAGPAQLTSVFDPVLNSGKEACFVQFTQILSPPRNGVLTTSDVKVRFSEPMNSATVTPFDTVTLTRTAIATSASQFVIGSLAPQEGNKVFQFHPLMPFEHVFNSATDDYFLNIGSGEAGPTDLAGNPIANPLPPIQFFIEATETTQANGGFVLRFNTADEILADNLPEVRGQFLLDEANGRLRPRPVTRYAAIADRTRLIPSIMPVFAPGVQTPLSSFGSKLQTLWRYCDFAFGLVDEANTNVDIEGLAWSPVGGASVADHFERFEIALAHSNKLPDESVDANLLPAFPLSGLVIDYGLNVLLEPGDPAPLKIVHDRTRGYTVNPADLFPTDTGTLMMPFPLNRGLPVSQHKYYTWRDTAMVAKGAIGGSPGAELAIVCQVLGGCTQGQPFPPLQVPTIGLPILMQFKTFPDDGALGLNSFDINLALNSSALPNFRAFSTGGLNVSGIVVNKDPDLELIATGGFNPTSTPPGATTLAADNTFYIGQLDLILRISRAHTIFFDTSPTVTSPIYAPPVVEPLQGDQPAGTRIDLAFRGATNVTGVGGQSTVSAFNIDPYGDARATGNPPTPVLNVTFFQNDKSWKPTLTAVNGARFFQTRITFVSNTETLLNPMLSALGFAFRSP